MNPIGTNLAISLISLSNCPDARPATAWQLRSENNSNVVFVQSSIDRVDLIERPPVGSVPDNDFTITHVARQRAGHGITDNTHKRASYVACVYLQRLDAYDILSSRFDKFGGLRCAWIKKKPSREGDHSAGNTAVQHEFNWCNNVVRRKPARYARA